MGRPVQNTATSYAIGQFRAVFPGANMGALKYRISGRGVLEIRNSRAWCAAAGQRAGGAGGLLVSLGLYFRAWTWGHGVFPGVDMGVGGGRAADRGGAADRPGYHRRRRRRRRYYYYNNNNNYYYYYYYYYHYYYTILSYKYLSLSSALYFNDYIFFFTCMGPEGA